MAKKKTAKKSSKKSSKKPSVAEEIKKESNISKEIRALEQQAKTEEANTERMEKEIEQLDHKVSEELAAPEEKLEEGTKKPKKMWLWIAIVVIIIALAAGFFFFFKISSPVQDEYVFTQGEDGYWYTEIGNLGSMPFYHHPDEVLDIPIDENAVDLVTYQTDRRGTLYLTLDPTLNSNQVLGAVEISKVTSQILAIPTKSAVWKDEAGIEKITCANATNTVIVMKFGLGSESRVSLIGNCVQVVAVNESEFTRLGDAFAYRLLGII